MKKFFILTLVWKTTTMFIFLIYVVDKSFSQTSPIPYSDLIKNFSSPLHKPLNSLFISHIFPPFTPLYKFPTWPEVVFLLSAALLGARFRSTDLAAANAPDDDDEHHDFEIPAGCNMGRRRSRAVLYQLSGHYKPEKTKPKLKLNNVSK